MNIASNSSTNREEHVHRSNDIRLQARIVSSQLHMRKYQLLGQCQSQVKGDDLSWVHVTEDLLGELGGLGVAGVCVLALVTNISTPFEKS